MTCVKDIRISNNHGIDAHGTAGGDVAGQEFRTASGMESPEASDATDADGC